jgi:hypothetical protein
MKRPTTLPPNRRASSERGIDRLFLTLLAMYGSHWLDLWIGCDVDAVKAQWAAALHGVGPDAIRLALDALVTKGKPFPPTMPEFVSLCRQFRKHGAPQLQIVDARRGDGPPGGFQELLKRATQHIKPAAP